MWALVRKEWYVMGRLVAQVALLWIVIAALFVWMNNERAAWLHCCNVPIFTIMLFFTSLDQDRRCGWDGWLAAAGAVRLSGGG